MHFQPCCGFYLQGAVKIIALFEILTTTVTFVVHLSIMTLKTFVDPVPKEEETPLFKSDAVFYLIIWNTVFELGFHLPCKLFLGIHLYKSAQARMVKGCKTWMKWCIPAHIIFCMNQFIFYIGCNFPLYEYFGPAMHLFFKPYAFYIVHRFIKEINSFGQLNLALTTLTEDEVHEFFKGQDTNSKTMPFVQTDNDYHTYMNLEKLPYNQDNFEVPEDRIKIDTASILGEGCYGIVYKGIYIEKDGTERAVAVKTTKPQTDMIFFKSILFELKVMSFIGTHCNILGFIGAQTSQIAQRKVFVILEFCPYGALDEILYSRRPIFVNQIKDDRISSDIKGFEYINCKRTEYLFTEDLLRFALEIATGMEYLTSKRVVHSDLAIRNVLLSLDKIIKISDFGMARRLYSDPTYRKKKVQPLAWRWMAPESLKDLTFSSKSDVWAYGISLWELFTLSESPFVGLSWTNDFIKMLESGLRLMKPRFATSKIYEIMLLCWNILPENRPSFTELRAMLHEFDAT